MPHLKKHSYERIAQQKIKFFHETTAIESVIKSQIVAAIDPIYLQELKNSTMET